MTPQELLKACQDEYPTPDYWDTRHSISLTKDGVLLLSLRIVVTGAKCEWLDLKFDPEDWKRPIEDVMKEIGQCVEANRHRLDSEPSKETNEPKHP